MKKKEIISIHIGGAGINLSHAFWRQLCVEHFGDYETDGFKNEEGLVGRFFSDTEKSKDYKPLAILADMDPFHIESAKKISGNLFGEESFYCGEKQDDASSDFASGYYGTRKEDTDRLRDALRTQILKCDNPEGFLLFHSMAGGTGSGLASLLAEILSVEYEKMRVLQFALLPTQNLQMHRTSVEAYNSLFSTHCMMEHVDAAFLYDNEIIFSRDKRSLRSFKGINSVLASVMAATTATLRFPCSINSTLKEMEKTLVPLRRLQFCSTTFPSLHYNNTEISADTAIFDSLSPKNRLTRNVVTPKEEKYMSCVINLRGDFDKKELEDIYGNIKKKKLIRFVPFATNSVMQSHISKPPVHLPQSPLVEMPHQSCVLSNSSSMGQVWKGLTHEFDMLYEHKAYMQWFLRQGMEESEFQETREDFKQLKKDYDELKGDDDGEVSSEED